MQLFFNTIVVCETCLMKWIEPATEHRNARSSNSSFTNSGLCSQEAGRGLWLSGKDTFIDFRFTIDTVHAAEYLLCLYLVLLGCEATISCWQC